MLLRMKIGGRKTKDLKQRTSVILVIRVETIMEETGAPQTCHFYPLSGPLSTISRDYIFTNCGYGFPCAIKIIVLLKLSVPCAYI